VLFHSSQRRSGLSSQHATLELLLTPSCHWLSILLYRNNLFSPYQSAYCKHHSTETAFAYIHDHLINATGSKQISCLCLLHLSAAFDTIDHNILHDHLSWFGIHGSVFNWFKRNPALSLSNVTTVSLHPVLLPVVYLKALISLSP